MTSQEQKNIQTAEKPLPTSAGGKVPPVLASVTTHDVKNAFLSDRVQQQTDIALKGASVHVYEDFSTVQRIQTLLYKQRDLLLARIAGDQFAVVNRLVKHTSMYALSSIITPLMSLVVAPLLTRTLSTTDYGVLMLLNTSIGLIAGITQLGLGSAFFRAYSYDYTDHSDKRAVVTTTTMLLLVVSLLMIIAGFVSASLAAQLLLGRASLSRLIVIACGIVFAQNLTIPVFAWLRAENRSGLYSLLAVGNMIITLISTIICVGLLHWGITGALLATGSGYMGVVLCTFPIVITRTRMIIRMDIVRNLLGFGVPLIFSFISGWVLQLSDRYLLGHFSSLAETARYTIAYLLGSAISVAIVSPFNLAWPTMIFIIAKRKEATTTFRLLFRWFGLFLLLATFGFSFVCRNFLLWFFPPTYHSLTNVIPIISLSLVFYALYLFFLIGPNLKRKTWLPGIIVALAATMNVFLNLILIPIYGAIGASLTTLFAYMFLAIAAYGINQKMYPIAFELGKFTIALLLGFILYMLCDLLTQSQSMYVTDGFYVGALILYGISLVLIGTFPWKNAYSL